MVPRYARPAMTAIWEPEARYRIWFEIEAHATDKLGELGVVPTSAGKALWDWWATKPKIDVAAVDVVREAKEVRAGDADGVIDDLSQALSHA